ncbi:MAG TPA: [FeFe] hydrogenase H-cluster radical SAM maturase HydE, partial [Spirochaetia bacterium]|nr:[FeFe] hydrogenase H-cluster radical SAM maturase HydE [Spirochaetia bacterium]
SLETKEERFQMGLKMIALLRIIMKDINIASTTALQTLDPIGREKGLLAGANILMPNITPQQYRGDYLLYQDKPCIGDTKEECKNCLSLRISGIGESIGYNEWGDSRHFYHKKIKH